MNERFETSEITVASLSNPFRKFPPHAHAHILPIHFLQGHIHLHIHIHNHIHFHYHLHVHSNAIPYTAFKSISDETAKTPLLILQTTNATHDNDPIKYPIWIPFAILIQIGHY